MREIKNSHCYFNIDYENYLIFDKSNLKRFENLSFLKAEEIKILENNGCWADDWNNVHVHRPFDPELVRCSEFHGKVAIGKLEKGHITFCGRAFPIGIYNSCITSSIIEDYPAVSKSTISDTVVGKNVIIHDCNEISSFSSAFSKPDIVNLGNEKCGREAVIFSGITLRDIWLQLSHKDDELLQQMLSKFSQNKSSAVSPYTYIGDSCVIENTRAIRSVKLGRRTVISGASRVEESSVNSSASANTVISDNAIVVDSVVESGVRVESNAFVEKSFLDRYSTVKQGARVIQSALGQNSTVACAEVQNSFLMPLHEQHHNSSFLIAATIGGQSNIASGATLGSNHNSRANDGELHAGRGFWAGLCTSVKHNSYFAPFTLLAKSDFMHELDISLPFSLVSNNYKEDSLSVMPAYWWRYNMYALFRNNDKFARRLGKDRSGIECSFMAPDTVAYILEAIDFLKKYRGEVPPQLIENSKRRVDILGYQQALDAYQEMLLWYSTSTVLDWIESHDDFEIPEDVDFREHWFNVCGLIVSKANIDSLVSDIKNGDLISWEDIQERFARFELEYPKERFAHAFNLLKSLHGIENFDSTSIERIKNDRDELDAKINEQIEITRGKDNKNPYRNTSETHKFYL